MNYYWVFESCFKEWLSLHRIQNYPITKWTRKTLFKFHNKSKHHARFSITSRDCLLTRSWDIAIHSSCNNRAEETECCILRTDDRQIAFVGWVAWDLASSHASLFSSRYREVWWLHPLLNYGWNNLLLYVEKKVILVNFEIWHFGIQWRLCHFLNHEWMTPFFKQH